MTGPGALLSVPFVVALNTSAPVFLMGQARNPNPQILVHGVIEGEIEEDIDDNN